MKAAEVGISNEPNTIQHAFTSEKIENTTGLDGPYVVIIYNDDWHTFPQVIQQVQKATGCPLDKAVEITDQVHNVGRAIAFAGSMEECERVATILRQIRLQVETDRAM
jgi:ATP-dependent Clp protease adapter protein ClpS